MKPNSGGIPQLTDGCNKMGKMELTGPHTEQEPFVQTDLFLSGVYKLNLRVVRTVPREISPLIFKSSFH